MNATGVKCGNCHEYHENSAAVRACYGRMPQVTQLRTDQPVQATLGPPATPKQEAYVAALFDQRVVPAANDAHDEFPYVERAEDLLKRHAARQAGVTEDLHYVGKHEASKVIGWMVNLPKKEAQDKPKNGKDNPYLAEAKKGDVHVVDGTYYRIHVGQNSGRPYAAQAHIYGEAEWATDGSLIRPADIKWRMARGMIYKLSKDTMATPEQAAAFGKLVGRCCFCSHAIDTPESTQAGYGPICAAKYDLPWG